MGNDRIIVLGTAPGWRTELQTFMESIGELGDVMAVNDAGIDYLNDIQHWCSLHPNLWFLYTPTFHVDGPQYALVRERAGGNVDYQKHSHMELPKPHFPEWSVWPNGWKTGSSALFGIYVALQLGYRKIVTVGVQLSVEPYLQYQKGWKDHYHEIKDFVRGMSGFPAALLGEPTSTWWNDGRDNEHIGSVGNETEFSDGD